MGSCHEKACIHCPHFPKCSGCAFNDRVDQPPLLAEVYASCKLWGVEEVQVISGSATGWRCRAKLAVRGGAEVPFVGLYQEGSHRVVDIPHCQVHHPALNTAANAIRRLISEHHIHPYDELRASGELRYLQLVVQRSTGKVQCAFVLNASLDDTTIHRWKLLVDTLSATYPDFWHSIWLNSNLRRDNVIFGNQWYCLKGETWLWEKIDRVEFAFSPATFGQANLTLFEQMIHQIRTLCPPGSNLVEYYCGVGAIGLNIAETCRSVRCCEVNPYAENAFKQALERLSTSIADKITFSSGDASDYLSWLKDCDLVIVDPPRKGLSESFLKAISAKESQARRLIYVSCGWKAFQRDCATLLEAKWHLHQVSAYVLFPGTNQIELVACFDRY